MTEYWGRTLAAAGAICPEGLSFKITCRGPGAPSAWQLRKGTDKLLVDRLRFCLEGKPTQFYSQFSLLTSFVCPFV